MCVFSSFLELFLMTDNQMLSLLLIRRPDELLLSLSPLLVSVELFPPGVCSRSSDGDLFTASASYLIAHQHRKWQTKRWKQWKKRARRRRDRGEESPQIPQRKILHTDVKSTRGRADVEVFTCLHLFLLVFVISLINIQIISRGGYRTESLSSAVKVGCSLCGASSVELLYCRAASRAKRAVCLKMKKRELSAWQTSHHFSFTEQVTDETERGWLLLSYQGFFLNTTRLYFLSGADQCGLFRADTDTDY